MRNFAEFVVWFSRNLGSASLHLGYNPCKIDTEMTPDRPRVLGYDKSSTRFERHLLIFRDARAVRGKSTLLVCIC